MATTDENGLWNHLWINTLVWLALGPVWLLRGTPHALIEWLLLLSPLAITPGLFRELVRPERQPRLAALDRLAFRAWPLAAVALVVSFLFSPGWVAGGLALPWLLFCGVVGLRGLLLLSEASKLRGLTFARLSTAVAMLYLPVGGGWVLISRVGLTPLGFAEPIVLLTGVHFHFAGFTTVGIVTALAVRGARSGGAWSIPASLAAWGLLVGPALLAAGFLLDPLWQMAAALFLSASGGVFGLVLLFDRNLLKHVEHPTARILQRLAGLSLLGAMCLSAAYAWSEFTREYFLLIPTMARTHGLLNAVGFALPSLAALRLQRAPGKPR